ncbi:MAG: hypothetical protein HFK07_05900 [Clostridia bacterium]|jgi:hypothetical protein|nr:hypothetical protein [Clostridia bacterium]
MSKRVLSILSAVIVIAVLIGVFAGCKPTEPKDFDTWYFPENFTAVDYSKFEEESDLDAFEMLSEAYENWINDTAYRREQFFTFYANDGKMAENFAHDVYKIDGDKIYREMVTIQNSTLAGNKRQITRAYAERNGEEVSVLKKVVKDDKKMIPGEGEGKEIFAIKSRPAMENIKGTSSEEEVKKEVTVTYLSHLTTYIWNDKDNLVDDGFKVYTDSDGNYRFSITINCSKEMMNSVHTAARDEFSDSTGAARDSLEMTENTVIDFVVKEVGGKLKFLGWRRTEIYMGKAYGLAKVNAKQCCVENFTYESDDYTITDSELA